MSKGMGIVAALAVAMIAAISYGDAARAQMGSMTSGPIPPYHASVPKSKTALRATLPPGSFPNDPVTERAYAVAAKIKPLLYQMPCYCHCDQELGHTSLLSCYQDRHAAVCGTCKMELYYAYMESRKGKTAKQIRAGIVRGDWEKVDLSKWSAPYPGPAPHAWKPAGQKQR
jgi:hypothetical protein